MPRFLATATTAIKTNIPVFRFPKSIPTTDILIFDDVKRDVLVVSLTGLVRRSLPAVRYRSIDAARKRTINCR